jgi:hypothetical protein
MRGHVLWGMEVELRDAGLDALMNRQSQDRFK